MNGAHGKHTAQRASDQSERQPLSSERQEAVKRALHRVMYATERAQLMARLLLGHCASLLAFWHQLEVPVHPSQQHRVGAKAQLLAEVCNAWRTLRHFDVWVVAVFAADAVACMRDVFH